MLDRLKVLWYCASFEPKAKPWTLYMISFGVSLGCMDHFMGGVLRLFPCYDCSNTFLGWGVAGEGKVHKGLGDNILM